jgi:predicted nucleotidyltransferase
MIVLDPIDTSGYTIEKIDTLIKKCRDEMMECLSDISQGAH